MCLRHAEYESILDDYNETNIKDSPQWAKDLTTIIKKATQNGWVTSLNYSKMNNHENLILLCQESLYKYITDPIGKDNIPKDPSDANGSNEDGNAKQPSDENDSDATNDEEEKAMDIDVSTTKK